MLIHSDSASAVPPFLNPGIAPTLGYARFRDAGTPWTVFDMGWLGVGHYRYPDPVDSPCVDILMGAFYFRLTKVWAMEYVENPFTHVWEYERVLSAATAEQTAHSTFSVFVVINADVVPSSYVLMLPPRGFNGSVFGIDNDLPMTGMSMPKNSTAITLAEKGSYVYILNPRTAYVNADPTAPCVAGDRCVELDSWGLPDYVSDVALVHDYIQTTWDYTNYPAPMVVGGLSEGAMVAEATVNCAETPGDAGTPCNPGTVDRASDWQGLILWDGTLFAPEGPAMMAPNFSHICDCIPGLLSCSSGTCSHGMCLTTPDGGCNMDSDCGTGGMMGASGRCASHVCVAPFLQSENDTWHTGAHNCFVDGGCGTFANEMFGTGGTPYFGFVTLMQPNSGATEPLNASRGLSDQMMMSVAGESTRNDVEGVLLESDVFCALRASSTAGGPSISSPGSWVDQLSSFVSPRPGPS